MSYKSDKTDVFITSTTWSFLRYRKFLTTHKRDIKCLREYNEQTKSESKEACRLIKNYKRLSRNLRRVILKKLSVCILYSIIKVHKKDLCLKYENRLVQREIQSICTEQKRPLTSQNKVLNRNKYRKQLIKRDLENI